MTRAQRLANLTLAKAHLQSALNLLVEVRNSYAYTSNYQHFKKWTQEIRCMIGPIGLFYDGILLDKPGFSGGYETKEGTNGG